MKTKMEDTKTELKRYREFFSKELHGNILPYWMKYGVEKNGHGFYGAVDLNNEPVLTANKTSVLNARILWTFSAAAMLDGNKEYAAMADRAYRVVIEDFEDKKYGGYYMELSSSDKLANDIKHTYAQAFVLYSLCKYYEFRKKEETLNRIQDFFRLLEEKTKDPDHIGYRESFPRLADLWRNRVADK
ncbi:MAG: AGE family epimerase/isomerase [Bacteroidetes bacterium]|nr:AGE family epimerase/isomerase [Bacteroidota bacterium]